MARNNLALLNNSIVRYESESGEVTLSKDIIKQYICPNANDQEIYMFLQLCKYQRLNPFLREAYLVKYGNQPAQLVTGKETFTKRAEIHPQFDGYETSIEVDPDNKKLPLTATAKVYRKDRKYPVVVTVDYDEYVQLKDGRPNRMWASKPKTMLRKVALMQALREAFPTVLGGMYSPEEVDVEVDQLPTGYIDVPKQPPKNNRNSKVNWAAFWASVKEMGFDEDDVHGIAGGIKGQPVDSIANWSRDEVTELYNKLKELHRSYIEAEQQEETPPEIPEDNQEPKFNPGEDDDFDIDEIEQGIQTLKNQPEPEF